MAHNQDRLQNSDSSVVYGHGHIIYSHTVKPMLWSSLDCCCCCSLTWATHHYDKPSNSQLWVWMALLKNTSQSISWRNVHFCIRSYSTLHTVYCGALPPPPKLRIAPFAPAAVKIHQFSSFFRFGSSHSCYYCLHVNAIRPHLSHIRGISLQHQSNFE